MEFQANLESHHLARHNLCHLHLGMKAGRRCLNCARSATRSRTLSLKWLIVSTLTLAPVMSASPVSSAELCRANEGKQVTIEDIVVDVTISKTGVAFLNFGDRYPNQTVAGVVPQSALANIGIEFINTLQGQRIRLTGNVTSYKGKPEIQIRQRRQIELVGSSGTAIGTHIGSPIWMWIIYILIVPSGIALCIVWVRRGVKPIEHAVRAWPLEIDRDDLAIFEEASPAWLDAANRLLMLSESTTYVARTDYLLWISQHCPLPPFPTSIYKRASPSQKRAIDMVWKSSLGEISFEERNQRYTAGELKSHGRLFDTLESNPLTEAQRIAVVTDEDNTLVVAGAGTGKTSTIVGKVAYILKKGLAEPEQILLLAYTRLAAEELQERIENRVDNSVGDRITVRTFHGLGLEILSKTEGAKPSLSKESTDIVEKRLTIKRILIELMKSNAAFQTSFKEFQVSYREPYRIAWEFNTYADYLQYLKNCDLRTLKGEKVKSLEEAEIANWLASNGIEYVYEKPYEHSTTTQEYRQYQPDFYLPKYQIYLEHFGLDKNGMPPAFFKDADKWSYIEGVKWKRDTHLKYRTRLVESYSWEKGSGILHQELQRKLIDEGVQLRPVSPEELLMMLNKVGLIDPFVGLVGTFLSLFKSSGTTPDALVALAATSTRNRLFCQLFLSIFEEYESGLKRSQSIDFDDMIERARTYVDSQDWGSPFKYIIVDEFQDISMGRAKFVIALRNQVPGCKLLCVGDDWQSIYRFAGSDVNCMTHFEHQFGYTATCLLDRTFRFPDKLAEFSARFVTQNPKQLTKNLISQRAAKRPLVSLCENSDDRIGIERILSNIAEGGRGDLSVLILTRNNFQLPSKECRIQWGKQFPDLDLKFMTVHKSKGLEADYVILDALVRNKYGFPNQTVDDPILQMVLSGVDDYPFAEERRLFYVGLTRAKEEVFLCTKRDQTSSFIDEIVRDQRYELLDEIGARVGGARCPSCGTGDLTKRSSVHGQFYGCTMYPNCDYTEPPCLSCNSGLILRGHDGTAACAACGVQAEVCPQCRAGILTVRAGQYGQYVQCTLWRAAHNNCRFKRNLDSNATRSL